MTRKVDSSGAVCFAGTNYRAGNKCRGRQLQAAVVDGGVEISVGETLIRRHPIRHDRTREHGALANPGGRPNRINAARTPAQGVTQLPEPNRNTGTGP